MTAATIFSPGLCLTCNNAPGCYYHARRGPALFCELFDDFVDLTARVVGLPASPTTPPAASASPAVAGLCSNCEHRQTCTHLHPEGGVWHCEDYE